MFVRKKKFVELQETLDAAKQSVHRLCEEMIGKGCHIWEQVFIPEYLKFTEHETEEYHPAYGKRFWTKQVGDEIFTLMRDTDNDKMWAVYKKGVPATRFILSSMFHALIILESMGFDVTLENYITPPDADSAAVHNPE